MTRYGDFAVRAATFAEILGPHFDTTTGSAGRAAARVDAWRRSSAAGNRQLFDRRLVRDGWSLDFVTGRFGGAVERESERPQWVSDSTWINEALAEGPRPGEGGEFPFAALFVPVVDLADSLLTADPSGLGIAESARQDLRNQLMHSLCELCAPVLYERFVAQGRDYSAFLESVDFAALLDDKPVLLRLIATLTRQWMTFISEFVARLRQDAEDVRRLAGTTATTVSRVTGGLSDRHDGGRSVLLVEFAGGRRVVYKPRDQHVDVAVGELVEWLNGSSQIVLRVARTVARDGYGWSEFVDHRSCDDTVSVARFYQRAGAWLALLHCLSAADLHHENLIAAGEHPVPVDLECILQADDPVSAAAPEQLADDAARRVIADSVIAVGLLPGFARVGQRQLLNVGGFAADWSRGAEICWRNINSDEMLPMWESTESVAENLPRLNGRPVGLGEHLEDFLGGFDEYLVFLASCDWGDALDRFSGASVRTVRRPTQFYHLLLTRLRDDRTMSDGVLWSVQADFVCRMADWNADQDDQWELLQRERDALLELTVPRLGVPASRGLRRVRDRLAGLGDDEIAWQRELIVQTSSFIDAPSTSPGAFPLDVAPLTADEIASAADAIAEEVTRYAIRRGPAAAWIGHNWFSDSDASQLAVLGYDLYNGNTGIALFFAAHARIRSSGSSADIAYAAFARIRAELQGRNAERVARLLGLGGATGLGSVVYALTVASDLLDDDALRADAHRAAELISDDLIARDVHFDIVGGSAGAILGLLRLYRDSGSQQALHGAVGCGDHLLAKVSGSVLVNGGMSHGTAGLAHALAALADATGRAEYGATAANYIGRNEAACCSDRQAASQWCHGAVGIGLARHRVLRSGTAAEDNRDKVTEHLLTHVIDDWPGRFDTLCCGSLGNIEYLRTVGRRDSALQRLSAVIRSAQTAQDYRWNGGAARFNVGLFRGLAGVGYTCLREVDQSLPNVLVWG